MNAFFLFIEIFIYLFALFLLFKKKDLVIIYLPVLIFSYNLIVPTFSASIYYSTICILLFASVVRNGSFFRHNMYAVILFFYFLLLLTKASDLEEIRPSIFSVSWLLISIPLIHAVFKKYDEQCILNEVGNAAILILGLFLINVLFSSIHRYSPNAMYGITSGVLYGNLYGAGFNILSLALFATVLRYLDKRRALDFLILIVSFAALMLSLRRSVMLVGALGVVIALLSLLTMKDAKRFVAFTCLLGVFGYLIYANTPFMNVFKERYEMRKLDERPLDEEKRLIEYELVYKDMFEYKDYSPWTGYEPFNSSGHYGRGIFELRTLHADLPSIAHSSGILGLVLYLLTVFTSFAKAHRHAATYLDKLILLFSFAAFTTFTITGRFTEAASMIFIFLLINMPLARSASVAEVELEEASELVPVKKLAL